MNREKKKIMFFRPMYYVGGTEIAILSLLRLLKGYEIYIGYTDETSDEALLNRYKKFAEVVNIEDSFTEKIDTLIICSPYKTALEIDSKVKRNKTILWFHHFGNRESSIFTDDRCFDIIDEFVTVSETCKKVMLKQDYAKKIKNKVKVVYNIIDVDDIIKKSNEPIEIEMSKNLNIVSVGRVCYEKGLERQLKLARFLKESNVDFKWFIIGGNYYKEVEDEIKDKYMELQDNFVFTGFLKNPFNILKKCDYLALLSDDETWGLAITEAKILKVPCIVTDFEVAYEQIVDDKTGIILSRTDTDSYKSKVDIIINNKEKYKDNLKNFKWSNEKTLNKWAKIL